MTDDFTRPGEPIADPNPGDPPLTERIPGVSWKSYKNDVRDAWDNLLLAVRRPVSQRTPGEPSPRLAQLQWILLGYLVGFVMAGLGFTVLRSTPTFLVLFSIPASLPLALALVRYIRERSAQPQVAP